MAGRMPGVAVVGAAGTVIVVMRGDMVVASAVLMLGRRMFNAGRGRAHQMRQRRGTALQGYHHQQRQYQYFSAEFEHERHSRV